MKKEEIIIKSPSKCFEKNIEKEWLITNGLGGYSSSTCLGINTRKYHGLLVSAIKPPGSRLVLLEKLDEDIIIDKEIFRLGANEFCNTIYPTGFNFIKKFSLNPYPNFSYENHNFKLDKSIFMHRKINAISVLYKIQNKTKFQGTIKIFPLLNYRYFHNTTNYDIDQINFSLIQKPKEVIIDFKQPKINLKIYSTIGSFTEKTNQIRKIFYRKEKSRGESNQDDCFQPGFFELKINPKTIIKNYITAISETCLKDFSRSIKKIGLNNKEIQFNIENSKRRELSKVDIFYSNSRIKEQRLLSLLLASAENFVINDKLINYIIAGYFWFGSWGRDTFISLPGLLLIRNNFKIAKNILYNFSLNIKDGLIPNFQSDQNHDYAYNSVDASLWYINAIFQFLKYTGDIEFIQKKLWKKILDIINSYQNGTNYDIKMDRDCLLSHGPQLTWMDAIVKGKPITPRAGKAVEIQALWYNALKITELLSNKFEKKRLAEKFNEISIKAKTSFNRKFFNPTNNCLFDVITKTKGDSSIRPNQIFSISLNFPILKHNQKKPVMDIVSSKLLTPYGLRTLDPDSPNYKGYYLGDRTNRDSAYHNGTVWPWLLGPYISAISKTEKSQQMDHNKKNLLINLLKNNLYSNGLGHINEIFDGNFPYEPRGCISQAWSVAELIRSYFEDILNIKPKHANILF